MSAWLCVPCYFRSEVSKWLKINFYLVLINTSLINVIFGKQFKVHIPAYVGAKWYIFITKPARDTILKSQMRNQNVCRNFVWQDGASVTNSNKDGMMFPTECEMFQIWLITFRWYKCIGWEHECHIQMWKWLSSGMLHYVAWKILIDVSEEPISCITSKVAVSTSEMSVISTRLHSATFWKTAIFLLVTVRTWNHNMDRTVYVSNYVTY
jgi:hypothetical protein